MGARGKKYIPFSRGSTDQEERKKGTNGWHKNAEM